MKLREAKGRGREEKNELEGLVGEMLLIFVIFGVLFICYYYCYICYCCCYVCYCYVIVMFVIVIVCY